ncbi:MAG: DUF452 family protein [Muribaculaceae bacterium]|nr:DUF452 family protein [Muribaculaceae bacterium]
MRRELIHSDSANRNAIAFFAGWAMDAAPFANLRKPGYDIYIMYDYREVDPGLYTELLDRYDSVAVVAWSFGVAIANTLITGDEEIRIAINGTPLAVHDTKGIPHAYNNLTLRRLSPATLATFYSRVFHDVDSVCLPSRPLDQLSEELRIFGSTRFPDPSHYWDKVYVSGADLIFPTRNQLEGWEGFNPVTIPDGWHAVDFNHILQTDIINKQAVGLRFTRRAESYDRHADVQRQMAATLVEKCRDAGVGFDGKDILELGIGTGFLTRLYSKHNPASALAVDLADSSLLRRILLASGCDFNGQIITADAERFIADRTDCYDVIISASTIQWFNSPKTFLSNAARALRKGGVLALSTFAPGTFHEVTDITGSSLSYHTAEWYAEAAPDCLKPLLMANESLTMTFANPRALLEHISKTGVNAIGDPGANVTLTRRLLKELSVDPKLTYNSIYLIFKKL